MSCYLRRARVAISRAGRDILGQHLSASGESSLPSPTVGMAVSQERAQEMSQLDDGVELTRQGYRPVVHANRYDALQMNIRVPEGEVTIWRYCPMSAEPDTCVDQSPTAQHPTLIVDAHHDGKGYTSVRLAGAIISLDGGTLYCSIPGDNRLLAISQLAGVVDLLGPKVIDGKAYELYTSGHTSSWFCRGLPSER